MTPPGQGGAQPLAPMIWWEWLFSVYPLDEFSFPCRSRNVQIAVAAAGQNTGTIEIIDAGFVYQVASKAVVTTTGAQPAFPYRIGLAQAGTDDWFGGNDVLAFSANMTGDDKEVGKLDHSFPMPRELEAGTQLTATVSNALNAATTLTCDVSIWYMCVRPRTNPIVRGGDGRVNWKATGA